MHAVLRFEELVTDPELRRTLASDPIVDTTLDLDLQREVSWQTWDAVRRLERRGAGNAAVLVVDRGSWEVIAAVGSTDYFDPDHAGASRWPTPATSRRRISSPASASTRATGSSASSVSTTGASRRGVTDWASR